MLHCYVLWHAELAVFTTTITAAQIIAKKTTKHKISEKTHIELTMVLMKIEEKQNLEGLFHFVSHLLFFWRKPWWLGVAFAFAIVGAILPPGSKRINRILNILRNETIVYGMERYK